MWPKGQFVSSALIALHFSESASFLLPRDALVHSAVLRLHVVRPSVRLSVTLVDQDHIGWKSWKLIARKLSLTLSLFVAERPSTYSQGKWGNLGEIKVGWRAGEQKRQYL